MTEPRNDEQGRDRRPPPSRNRVLLWIVGAAVGGYLVISGVVGMLTHG